MGYAREGIFFVSEKFVNHARKLHTAGYNLCHVLEKAPLNLGPQPVLIVVGEKAMDSDLDSGDEEGDTGTSANSGLPQRCRSGTAAVPQRCL